MVSWKRGLIACLFNYSSDFREELQSKGCHFVAPINICGKNSMNDTINRVKGFIYKTFSSRKQEWLRQSEFISALAEANDISYDPVAFPKPKRHLTGHGNVVWEQSQAAEYISEKIHEKMMRGEYVFKPWNAAWLLVRKSEVYDTMPYSFIPIKDTPERKASEGKIWAFVFSKNTEQEQWIDRKNIKVRAICKDCMFIWERDGQTNLDDNIEITNPDGTKKRVLKCPKCGRTRIYKDAHWI